MPANADFQRRLGTIEELLRQIESAADPSLRSTVRELVELVMELHGEGLARILDLIRASADEGHALVEKLGRDELVTSLMVLYGLHPLTLEQRVAQSLEKVRGRLRPHGGEVELLSVQEGEVRLRMRTNTDGCGSTAATLKEVVEEAVYQAAPDLTTLTIEGPPEKQSFVPLEMLRNRSPASLAAHGNSTMNGSSAGASGKGVL